MVQINIKNVLAVLGVIAAVVLGVVLIFLNVNVGGLIIGTTTNVATSGQINVSANMTDYLQSTEASYISAAQLTTGNVTLAISILAIVIILVLFGITTFTKGSNGGKGMGGLE